MSSKQSNQNKLERNTYFQQTGLYGPFNASQDNIFLATDHTANLLNI